MGWLVSGLVLFFLSHGIRLYAGDFRRRMIEQHGKTAWRIGYSVLSLASVVLIVVGYGLAKQDTAFLYALPLWATHAAASLMIVSMILLVASGGSSGYIKAKLKHPMVLAVKVWAFAHLLVNGTTADVVLFGFLLLWAIAVFRVLRKEDRAMGVHYEVTNVRADFVAVGAGVVIWVLFVMFLHEWLIGVAPFG